MSQIPNYDVILGKFTILLNKVLLTYSEECKKFLNHRRSSGETRADDYSTKKSSSNEQSLLYIMFQWLYCIVHFVSRMLHTNRNFFHKIGIIHQLKRNKYSLLKYTTKYHEIHTTYIISLTSYIWCGYNMVPYEPGELICCSVTRLQWVFNTGWCLYTDCLSCM